MNVSEILSRSSAFPLLGAFALYFLVGSFLPTFLAWVLVGSVFATAVIPVWQHRVRAILVLSTGVVGLTLCAAGVTEKNASLIAPGLALLAVQITTVVAVILSAFLRLRDVSSNAIAGAVAGYLLLGFLWAALFGLVEIAFPGSLTYEGLPLGGREDPLGDVVYYSYVTLTTVGYGDVVPQPGPARSLAILEAASGQLYIAIVVAGLVGRYAMKRGEQAD